MKIICAILSAAFLLLTTAAALPDSDSEPVGFISLVHADRNGVITVTTPAVSVLGACDPDYPLYFDGEIAATTSHGYFSVFVQLEQGENLFTLQNGDFVLELTVVRERPRSTPNESVRMFSEGGRFYATATNGGISRFYDRDDHRKPGTPLADGASFRIIGEHGDCYILHDGSYIFKTSANRSNRSAAENFPLYSVDFRQGAENDSAEITVFSLDDEPVVTRVQLPHRVSGYYAYYEDGTPVVEFKPYPSALSEAVVLIDAGHGGADPGALGPPGAAGLMEKDLNLHVARRAVEYLEAAGVRVIFSRDTDESLHILDRTILYENRENLPDLAISVHANSMPMGSDFASQAGSLMFYTLPHSERAANVILSELSGSMGAGRATPAIQKNFAMARYTAAPSMLFEMGFVCNPHEYQQLTDPEYLDRLGDSLGAGVVAYLESVFPLAPPPPESAPPAETVPVTAPPETATTAAVTRSAPIAIVEVRSPVGDIAAGLSAAFILGFFGFSLLSRFRSRGTPSPNPCLGDSVP